jgi:DCN1-like protein 1/2
VKQFISITQCDENTAINCLSSHDWKLEIAVDGFFQNPLKYLQEKPVTVDKKKINSLFEQYRDSVEEDKMLAHGICKFCEDVCVDPASLKVLILAWTCRAAVQCEFTRAEFVRGMTELGWVTLLSNVIFIIILLCLHLYSN